MGVLSWLFGGVEPKDLAQIDNPAAAFDKPSDVVQDASLSPRGKEGRPQHLGAGRPSAHDCQQRGDAWSP